MAKVCRQCGGLNGDSESKCYRCGRRLPGPLSTKLAAFDTRMIATRGLLLVNLAVFGLAVAADGNLPFAPELRIGESFRASTRVRFGVFFPVLLLEEPWRLVSAVFFHFSALHLGLNLWGLVGFGRQLEERFGWARSLLVFLLAGIGGFVVSTWWYGMDGPPTAGASGGVFGQLGAVMGVIAARKQPDWKDLLIQNLVYALVLGLMMRVNNAAHFGGCAIGFGLGYLFQKERVRPVVSHTLAVLALAGAVLSVGSVAAATQSPHWKQVRQDELRADA